VRDSTIGNQGAAGQGPSARDGHGRPWSQTVLVAGLAGLASVLPFVVTTRWYDYYYWPKVQALYAVLIVLALLAFTTSRHGWLERLGSRVGTPLAAWLAAVAASTVLSVNPLLSLVGEDYRYEGLLTWLAYGAVVVGVAGTITTSGRIRVVLGAVLSGSGVMAILGLLQHVGWTPVPEDVFRTGWARAWGTTGSPLALGAYLVLLLPVLIGLYAAETRIRPRCVYGGLAVLLYAALVATSARAAWGALAVGLAAWALASGRDLLRRQAPFLLLLAGAWAVVTPVVVWTSPPPVSSHTVSGEPVEQRMVLWRTVAPLVLERPVLGWGPETLAQIYPAYGSPEFLRAFPQARIERIYVDRPHNDLLQQAVSTGLLGLAAYVWMWGAVFAATWRAARAAAPATPGAGAAAGMLGGFAAYFCQLQFSFSYVSVAPVFWTLVGVALVLEHDTHGAPPSTVV
jgi:hypothetical protein